MAADRGPTAIVRRLETSITDAIRGRDRVILAYSGGLKSTLIAMIARKRCDLTCIVAGTEGSADVEAGKRAKQHLDYRLETILLDSAIVQEIDRRLRADHPRLTNGERHDLIPVFAVLQVAGGEPIIAGFAGTLRASSQSVLDLTQVAVPLHVATEKGRMLNRQLRAAALELGLPPSWANVRHRDPLDGAGIRKFLG